MTAFEHAAVAAAAANHQSWQAALAAVAGGLVQPLGEGTSVYLPTGGGDLQALYAGESADPGGLVDRVLASARGLGEVRDVGWWAAARDDRLAGSLLARGFQWGWRPRWMAFDLAGPAPALPAPPGIALEEVLDDVDWQAADLPYHDPPWERRFGALVRQRPGRTVILAVREGNAIRGKVILHVQADGSVGGVYECGVAETARRRGIGAALTAAAVRRARELGCRLAVLNATPIGEPVYRRVGFVPAGWGPTWWLLDGRATREAPSPDLVRLVEAIADDVPERIHEGLAATSFEVRAKLPCGLPPLGVAVRLNRQRAARQLLREGARLDLLSAWDLGWRSRAAAMLRANPRVADRPRGRSGATLVHRAVERGDEDLLRLLLGAGPDLRVRDRTYGSTALGWAENLGRTRLAALLREAGSASR
ncbi:MAG: GNAT family N-acetyltransferase [Candidatus Dormibacteraceae bacterium]